MWASSSAYSSSDLRLRHPHDVGTPFAAEEQAAAVKLGVVAHQRMHHVRHPLAFGFHLGFAGFGEQRAEQAGAAVLHLQAVDAGAGFRRQGLVGGDAVGIAGFAGFGRHDQRVEEGEQPGLGQMIMVGMPVQPDAGGADAFAVLLDIADDENLVVVGQAVMALGVQVGRAAETAREGQIGIGVRLSWSRNSSRVFSTQAARRTAMVCSGRF